MSELEPASRTEGDPTGIGGWLLVPVVLLFVFPVLFIVQLIAFIAELNRGLSLDRTQAVYLLTVLAANFVFNFVLPVSLIVLMFRKSKNFVSLYMIWAISRIAFAIASIVASRFLFWYLTEFDLPGAANADMVRRLLRAAVEWLALTGIWMPYLLTSRRVRNTFVNP